MMALVAIFLSYILGSIPTGLWLGKAFRGIDIRECGSRNIGATNTFRVLGWKFGLTAFIGDVAKGMIPVLLFARLGTASHLPLICGLAAVAGHTASLFLRFRGGKGVATGAGMYLALCPWPTLIAATVFAVVFAVTRMVSAGSMLAVVVLAVAVFFMEPGWTIRLITILVAVWIVWRHRSNIERILKGEENTL